MQALSSRKSKPAAPCAIFLVFEKEKKACEVFLPIWVKFNKDIFGIKVLGKLGRMENIPDDIFRAVHPAVELCAHLMTNSSIRDEEQ